MDTFPRDQILELCKLYGPLLAAPAGIDGARLMWAIAGNESSFGKHCTPRHEPAYDIGGHYDRDGQHALLQKYGHDAAYSYSPWQLMLCNAPGYSPAELRDNPELAAQAFVAFFNRYIIRHCGARTLEQCAEAYNAGAIHLEPAPGVLRYISDCRSFYEETRDVLA